MSKNAPYLIYTDKDDAVIDSAIIDNISNGNSGGGSKYFVFTTDNNETYTFDSTNVNLETDKMTKTVEVTVIDNANRELTYEMHCKNGYNPEYLFIDNSVYCYSYSGPASQPNSKLEYIEMVLSKHPRSNTWLLEKNVYKLSVEAS